jgi:hypothetical protein
MIPDFCRDIEAVMNVLGVRTHNDWIGFRQSCFTNMPWWTPVYNMQLGAAGATADKSDVMRLIGNGIALIAEQIARTNQIDPNYRKLRTTAGIAAHHQLATCVEWSMLTCMVAAMVSQSRLGKYDSLYLHCVEISGPLPPVMPYITQDGPHHFVICATQEHSSYNTLRQDTGAYVLDFWGPNKRGEHMSRDFCYPVSEIDQRHNNTSLMMTGRPCGDIAGSVRISYQVGALTEQLARDRTLRQIARDANQITQITLENGQMTIGGIALKIQDTLKHIGQLHHYQISNLFFLIVGFILFTIYVNYFAISYFMRK